LELIAQRTLRFENAQPAESSFLDDLRIGLRLSEEILEIGGPVDISCQPDAANYQRHKLNRVHLMPGRFYLGTSRETFSIPNNIMGVLNTRSKYARLGLELARFSVYVAPGFGADEPASFVFEISPSVEIKGLSPDIPYGLLLLFEFEDQGIVANRKYSSCFPFA
jgi:deoxycytidine triphosphate deaminase